PTSPGHIIHVEDGESGKVLPHPGNQLGTAETRHVVVGDDEVEFGLSRAGRVQCRAPVGYCNHLKAIVRESPGYQSPDHRLVVDYKNAVGQRPSRELSVMTWEVPTHHTLWCAPARDLAGLRPAGATTLGTIGGSSIQFVHDLHKIPSALTSPRDKIVGTAEVKPLSCIIRLTPKRWCRSLRRPLGMMAQPREIVMHYGSESQARMAKSKTIMFGGPANP